jgi:ABC-type multidrug transport system ATPase subunit
MLTGLLPSTSGSAHLFGLSVFDDIQRVREMLGVCPQQDVLFDMLTVQEHLIIFS